MALKKLVLKPGINKEGTNYSNEDGFYNCDKIRFRSGYAEKLGGWKNIGPYTYEGVARSMWAWVSLSGEGLLGIGTTQKFYIEYGTKYYDITPIRLIDTLAAAAAFTTYAGELKVDVSFVSAHGATWGSFVTFTKAYGSLNASILTDTPVGGTITVKNLNGTLYAATAGNPGTIMIDNEQIKYESISGPVSGVYTLGVITRGANGTVPAPHLVNAQVISKESMSVGGLNMAGEFQVYSVASTTTLTVISPTAAGAAGTYSSGGYAIFQINAGDNKFIAANGWGGVPYSTFDWGSLTVPLTASTYKPFRVWTEINFDESLIFAPKYGSIYWWDKDTLAFPRGITLNDKANTQIKQVLTGNGTSLGATYVIGGTSITVTDITGANFGAVVYGTGIPDGAYIDPTWDQSNTIPLLTAPGVPAVMTANVTYGTVSFSYSGRHVPVKTLLITTSSSNAITVSFGSVPYNPRVFSDAANFDPLLIRWSDQDNPYEWIPEVTNQSGEQRLANGSQVVSISNTRDEILVWTDTALYSMQYVGPPYVWTIKLLMDNISVASSTATITVNSVTYWMGMDKFYMYSGRVETLPCALRQFIFGRINKAQMQQVQCGSNEGFNEIWWFYPAGSSTINNEYVIFNHVEQLWYYGTIDRTTWLDSQLKQYPLGAFSTERCYLAEALPAGQNFVHVTDSSSLPYTGTITINSEQMTYTANDYNNNVLTGVTRGANSTVDTSHKIYAYTTLNTPNQVMYHENGWDDGSVWGLSYPIYSYIDSSDFDLEDGLNFSYAWRILPDLTFSGSTVESPRCYLTVKVRQNSGSAYTVHGTDSQAVTRTATYPVEQYTGQVYTRVRGRQMAFKMESFDLGVFWQMGMMRIDIRPDGRR